VSVRRRGAGAVGGVGKQTEAPKDGRRHTSALRLRWWAIALILGNSVLLGSCELGAIPIVDASNSHTVNGIYHGIYLNDSPTSPNVYHHHGWIEHDNHPAGAGNQSEWVGLYDPYGNYVGESWSDDIGSTPHDHYNGYFNRYGEADMFTSGVQPDGSGYYTGCGSYPYDYADFHGVCYHSMLANGGND
jgi:hypothetical protein